MYKKCMAHSRSWKHASYWMNEWMSASGCWWQCPGMKGRVVSVKKTGVSCCQNMLTTQRWCRRTHFFISSYLELASSGARDAFTKGLYLANSKFTSVSHVWLKGRSHQSKYRLLEQVFKAGREMHWTQGILHWFIKENALWILWGVRWLALLYD